MSVVKIENGAVVQWWKDCEATEEKTALEVFEEKYGLSGPEYIEADQPPGRLFDGSTFSDAPPPAPSTDPADYPLRRWQFHAMVDIIGKRNAIDQAINAMTDLAGRAVSRAKFEQADLFLRGDPLVEALAAAVGMTAAELDAAWLDAKDLT